MNWFLASIFGSLAVRFLWTVLTFNKREAEYRYYRSSASLPNEYWRGIANVLNDDVPGSGGRTCENGVRGSTLP